MGGRVDPGGLQSTSELWMGCSDRAEWCIFIEENEGICEMFTLFSGIRSSIDMCTSKGHSVQRGVISSKLDH